MKADLIVEMRTGGASRTAYLTDNLPLLDGFSSFHQVVLHMGVDGSVAVAMVDFYVITVPPVSEGLDDHSSSGGPDFITMFTSDVDPFMNAFLAVERIGSVTIFRSDQPLNGSAQRHIFNGTQVAVHLLNQLIIGRIVGRYKRPSAVFRRFRRAFYDFHTDVVHD